MKALFKVFFRRSKKYYCNICGNSIHRFLPLIGFYEEKMKENRFPYPLTDTETLNTTAYRCTECSSSDRDRLFGLYINKFLLDKKSNISLLDIAPAKALKDFIKKKTQIIYRSADLYMEGVDDKIDVTDMHLYKDESFDFFICSHVLEHVKDDLKAMRELYRVLKKGGSGIVMVPIFLSVTTTDEDESVSDESERWRRFGQDDHVRLYSKHDFISRLSKVGFNISEIGVNEFGIETFRLHGICKKSILYIVEK